MLTNKQIFKISLLYVPMWEINISRSSVDSLRTLQSKLSPPGERPPCSNTVWEKYGQIYYLKKKETKECL